MKKKDKIVEMANALLVCRKIFEQYAILHKDKNTDEGRVKAKINQGHADDITEVLRLVGFLKDGE
jgi:hypothetical protein